MAPKSLCLTAAFAPVPAFLGGSCPLGCSLSAPATGGLSMVSPQCAMYAAGSEKEKRAWGPLHWGYYSTLVRILQWGGGITWAEGLVVACALLQGRVCLGLRRCPTCPPSNVFRNRGTPPVPPAGAAPPAPRLGNAAVSPPGASGCFLARGRGIGTLPKPSPEYEGRDRGAPGGLGEGDGTVAKRDPARSGRGHSPVKRGHSVVIAPTAVRPRCDGLFPAGAALRRFSEQGDTLHPRRGLRALHVAWGRDGGVVISRWRVGSPFLACP